VTIVVDGELLPDDLAPRRDRDALAPFETMGAKAGDVPLWRDHVARITAAAATLGLEFTASPELRAAASELLRTNGDTDGILKLTLIPSEGRTRVVLSSRSRGTPLSLVKLLPTVVERPVDLRSELKTTPRPFYDAVFQQAQDGGADDGIVVGKDGAILETAIGNLWLRIHSVWVTPALDGRVLPGIARARLLAEAKRKNVTIVERRCELDDLHRAEGLAHSNAVYGPRTAVLVGQPEPAVRFADTELGPLWRLPVSG